mgnify:CR=1 FL=1
MTDSNSKKIETYSREAAFATLNTFDALSKPNEFMEVTLWHNGEGFDVEISNEQRFCLSWGQYKALKKLIKEVDR